MSPNRFARTTRSVKRFERIARILARYGLADWLGESSPEYLRKHFVAADGQHVSELPGPVRLRMALTELGPTFIKLGQMLSTRSDLIGPELAHELASLQADTPPDPPDVVRTVVEEDLGRAIDEVFADFDFQALASASIGQVHLATLRGGSDVIVKVQHQGIDQIVGDDLDILTSLAQLAEKNSAELRMYRPTAIVAEFRRTLLREMDFEVELSNLRQFLRNFDKQPNVVFPRPHPELSTRRLLVMDRMPGYSIADLERLDEDGVDRGQFTDVFTRVMLDMLFRDGFYHADPHPGNVFHVPPERLGLLDCGKVGYVDDQTQESFTNIMQAMMVGDARQLADEFVQIADTPPDLDRDALAADVGEFLAEFRGQADAPLNLTTLFNTMFAVIRSHRLVIPARMALLFLVVMQMEGTARQLNPSFSLMDALQDYRLDLLRQRVSPDRISRQMMRVYRDWSRLGKAVPREIAELLTLVRTGQLEVKVSHTGRDRQVNRGLLTLLIAATLLASGIILALAALPLHHGASLIGVIGLVVAAILALVLLRAIWKSGGLS